jgi:hypothetical protein
MTSCWGQPSTVIPVLDSSLCWVYSKIRSTAVISVSTFVALRNTKPKPLFKTAACDSTKPTCAADISKKQITTEVQSIIKQTEILYLCH